MWSYRVPLTFEACTYNLWSLSVFHPPNSKYVSYILIHLPNLPRNGSKILKMITLRYYLTLGLIDRWSFTTTIWHRKCSLYNFLWFCVFKSPPSKLFTIFQLSIQPFLAQWLSLILFFTAISSSSLIIHSLVAFAFLFFLLYESLFFSWSYYIF